jgi:hypothetical protein
MSDALRKFIPRAPRYVLRPNDRHIVRYSTEGDRSMVSINRTVLLNISESGVAIEMDLNSCPHLGERLMIELPVPGGDQIAWYARVVRTQLKKQNWWAHHAENEPEKVVVALKFEDLPQGHRKAIRRGLDERFIEELRDRRARQWLYLKSLWIENTWKILGYTVGILAVAGLIYWLSRPTANYDAKRGSPWGQRYQFFDFEKEK